MNKLFTKSKEFNSYTTNQEIEDYGRILSNDFCIPLCRMYIYFCGDCKVALYGFSFKEPAL